MLVKEKFREWMDEQQDINNSSFSIKLVRVIIRFSVRILGIKNAFKFLKFINKNLFKKKIINNRSYISYLIELNLLRLNVIISLKSKNLDKYIEAKIRLCELIISNSYNDDLIENAKIYKLLLTNRLDDEAEYDFSFSKSNREKKEKFYIYGPNKKTIPNKKYSDYTIIFLKPYPDDINYFKKSILFVNAFYYTNIIKNDFDIQKKILHKYSECIVGAKYIDLTPGFKNAGFYYTQGHIASLMALGRLLYYLSKTYKNFDCVIEGFDLYLERDSYQNPKYHKITRDKNTTIKQKEVEVCLALIDHDFMFNFIVIKELLKDVNLIDSSDFKKIIQLNNRQYADKLFEIRNFALLSQL